MKKMITSSKNRSKKFDLFEYPHSIGMKCCICKTPLPGGAVYIEPRNFAPAVDWIGFCDRCAINLRLKGVDTQVSQQRLSEIYDMYYN